MACKRLDKASLYDILKTVDTFLFDCDGVLWNVNGLIPGSDEAVKSLQQMGKKVLFITNNCAKTRAQYAEQLCRMGFKAAETDVMCTSHMAAKYLYNRKFKGNVYLIGNSNISLELDAFHIQHFGQGPDPVKGEPKDWVAMELDPDVRCVLVGSDPHFNFMKLVRAARYLERQDCLLLTTNMDPTHPPVHTPRSTIAIPGTGAIAVAVSYATKKEPLNLGKPNAFMFEELRRLHNFNPSRSIMIGDTVKADIGLAKASGIRSLLVLSGVTPESQIPALREMDCMGIWGSSTDPCNIPDFYTNCAGDLVTLRRK